MSAVDTLRDALFGNPPSPTTEPSREGTLAAFTEMYQQFFAGATVTPISATSYALLAADVGKLLNFTAATSITVTVPAGLPVDFYCSITQGGLGQVTIAAGDGVTLVNADGEFSTEARYVRLSLYATAADSYVLEGRTV